MIDDEELLNEFLVESFENLDRLDQDFIELERDPGSREILASIFRTVHTIKGTSGFLGFDKLQSVTHVGENLLGKLRDGKAEVNEEITSTLLRMVDAVRDMLGSIETARSEGAGEYGILIESLTRLYEGASALAEPQPEIPAPVVEIVEVELTKGRLGALLVDNGLCTKEAVIDALRAQMAGDNRRLGEILVERGQLSLNQLLEVMGESTVKQQQAVEKVKQKAIEEAQRAVEADAAAAAPREGRSIADSSVRVDVSLLDNLIDLVGELVLARNQLVQLTGSRAGKGNPTAAAAQRVSHITSDLQERVMKTRMQPINTVWGKLPRVVRDLAVVCGKQVRVEMEGQDTELDKTIIEAIKDPLTHIVRNSVDHGIETPERRMERGKVAEGRILLRAYHEGGKVVIEISDDGGGIDPSKVKGKAMEKGLITPEQAAEMSDHDAIALIFMPGFSTAEQITNVSGRGVGMDVVKTNIEKIGGSLDVHSEVGNGSTLVIRIPLTLAIVPALIVTSGGARFAIPQPNLLELVRFKDSSGALELIEGAAFYRLRGQLLPVVDLGALLELKGVPAAAKDADGATRKPKARSLAVLHSDGRQFGLIVDRVNDAEEIVVKPLGRHLKSMDLFAGCTIMGDGAVALILDVMSIAMHARIGVNQQSPATQDTSPADQNETLLVCTAGGTRVAIPLSKVARLDHVDPERIDHSGQQEVVRYGSTLLPVVRLGSYVGANGYGYDTPAGRRLKVVVSSEEATGRSVGMVVDQILDSVQVPIGSVTMRGGGARFGVLGTAVITETVTDVIDVESISSTVDDSYFESTSLLVGS